MKFVIMGNPIVQKNNLEIYKIKRNNKMVSFIDHSKKMKDERSVISASLYNQYKSMGGSIPIDYLFEMDMKFFCNKSSEPDLDNLPSIVLDAMLGIVSKVGNKRMRIAAVISDDKLLRKIRAEKIVKGDAKYHGEPRTEFTLKRY